MSPPTEITCQDDLVGEFFFGQLPQLAGPHDIGGHLHLQYLRVVLVADGVELSPRSPVDDLSDQIKVGFGVVEVSDDEFRFVPPPGARVMTR